MVLCDLPYGTTESTWDSVIPFPDLWAHYKRITKQKSAIVLTAVQPFTTDVISSNRAMFKYCWYWEKSKGANFALTGFQPLKVVEDIVVFSTSASTFTRNDNGMVYNPQKIKLEKPYTRNHSIGKNLDAETTPRISNGNLGEVTRTHSTPRNLLYAATEGDKRVHPTQKPVSVMEYLINTYTNEGDTVLDNCMGSASTGVACANSGRKFIGIERERRFFDVSCERLESLLSAPKQIDFDLDE
jgi:site-specific DNA-methyltransferase (adenine-specific)